MAIGWLASLKSIPWSKVVSMAPSIVEGGRKLLRRTANEAAPAQADSGAAIETRLRTLEREAAAAFEVVKSIAEEHSRLAEQHAELVRAVDALLARTRLLIWLSALLALALIASLVLVAGR